MINVLIPMAGFGSRFVDAGFKNPKPFIDVNGSSMIELVLNNLYYPDANYILIARKEHLESKKKIVEHICSNYNVQFIGIDRVTEGAACTVLFARELINTNTPLVIANSDQVIDFSFKDFVNDCYDRKLDGSIITFKDINMDPKWSFVSLSEFEFVTEVKEKVPISDIATVGIYMFLKGSDFVNAAIDMIINNDRVNNEFYVCPVYNYAIANNKKIGIFNVSYEKMHGLGTPADLQCYIDKKK